MGKLDALRNTLREYITGKSVVLVSRAGGKSTISKEYTSAQTALALITPGAGRRLLIDGVFIETEAAAGEIQLDFVDSGIKVFRHYASKTHLADALDCADRGGVNESLKLTTTTGEEKVYLKVNYREID